MKNRYLRPILMAASISLPLATWAQAPAAPVNQNFWQDTIGTITMAVAAVVIMGALLAITKLFTSIVKMQEIQMLREKGIEEVVEAYRAPQESWWSRMYKSMTQAVPVEHEADIDLGHDYDGIRELDNKLPPWWLGMFYLSIVFAFVYMFAFHMSDIGASSKQEYETEMEVAKAEVNAYLATQGEKVNETNVTVLTDPQEVAMGASIFEANCVSCHGKLAEGGIGPNMTDDYWLHGGSIQDMFKVIKNGVPEKGMISWSEQLRASDMQRVASYIMTLKGTNPPNAKEPQGDLYKSTNEGTTAPTDTTAAAVPATEK